MAWIKQGRAGDHDTRRVDDGDLHGLFVGRVFILDKGLPFVFEASALVASPHELQQVVDLARRARYIFPRRREQGWTYRSRPAVRATGVAYPGGAKDQTRRARAAGW